MAGPRITPGTSDEVGRVNFGVTRLLGWATGGTGPPNLFTTLARHRGLFRPWLRFAGKLMPGGTLPRRESELVILRVAHNCRCEYEWHHHEVLGAQAGLSPELVEAVRSGPEAEAFSEHDAALIRAADELHADRRISDELWEKLASAYPDHKLIELCMLIGHYEMIAMTINSIGVVPDEFKPGGPPRIVRAVQKRLAG